MPFYTICATDKLHAMRPCAIIDATGLQAAQQEGEKLRKEGVLGFLPENSKLKARLAARREVSAFLEYLRQPTLAPSLPQDTSRPRRAKRLEEGFFQRLWREGLR